MKINKESNVPLYLQLKNLLMEEIENTYEQNEKLDSEREICEKYQVSRTTVREALDELQKDKYINKVHGKGNFILKRRVEQNLVRFYSFTNEMRKIGRKPESKVISFSIEEVEGKISKKISKEKSLLICKIVRVRLADSTPMIYEITYLPYEKFKGLTKERVERKPLYDIFKEEFGVKITSAEEYLEPVLSNKLESLYLDIKEGEPSLKIERITYEDKQVIEYTISIARGDKFKYKINLAND